MVSRHPRFLRGCLVVCVVVVAGVAGADRSAAAPAPPSSPAREPTLRPPVEGVITDHFRPPPSPYAAGNRGIDYRVTPLTPVRAAADGEVIFAGQVGGVLHVTVRHPDGLRTTYSFLAVVEARVGQQVRQGDPVGATGDVLHFGVRDPGDAYLDPEALFRHEPPIRVHLVPSGEDGATPTAPGVRPERVWLRALVDERWPALDLVSRGIGWSATAVRGADDVLRSGAGYVASDLAQRLRFWAHNAYESRLDTHARRVVAGIVDWSEHQEGCTPAADPVPRIQGRRIVVEVAGIGSTSEHASVDRVATAELGYAPGDVLRFSYGGGRVPAGPPGATGATGSIAPLAAIATTTYDAADSQGDLNVAGDRLRLLLEQVAAAAPGVPIDVVAHSQGGVVARLAINQAERLGRLPVAVEHLVTLGTPHEGADLASLVEAVGDDPAGLAALVAAQRTLGLDLDPTLPAAHQLVATSPVIESLRTQPPPSSVHISSIGARGDLVVPAGRTTLRGSHPAADVDETVVPLTGVHAHEQLPGAPATTREIGLAVNGLGPTCRGLAGVATDLIVSEGISWSEAALAHGAPGP